MRPNALLALLAQTIPARRPVLITGGPGEGKSDIVAQATEAAGADLVISHPAVEDPTDAKGLPWIAPDATHAQFLPLGQVARVLGAERDTVWFLDDFGQAPASMQAAYMQWILAREINGHRLPDCVTIIAATNRRTDRAGVSGILEPVKSRFATIVNLETSIQDWSAWALRSGKIPAELVAFLRFRPDLLSKFEPSADLTNSPSPRTWTNAAAILALDLDRTTRAEALAGAVGEGASLEFLAFLEMYRSLPSIDAILLDPDAALLPSEPSALYATATALAQRATEASFPRVARYAERLSAAQRGDFAALLVRDSLRRFPAVQHTPAFVSLISGPLGNLIHGSN